MLRRQIGVQQFRFWTVSKKMFLQFPIEEDKIADLKKTLQVYSFRPTAFLWRSFAGVHSLWRCG
jgi:hypothetical protein